MNLYKDGLAPRDSVNWGFNEIVAGFYSGTCAMVDQDTDALIAIAERMKPDEYGVAPMPKGPLGKAFPTVGYVGWSIFKSSLHKDLGWKLIKALDDPAGNLIWNKRVGALPIYKAAEQAPFYSSEQLKGWFQELSDPDEVPTLMPTNLPGFAYFADSLVVRDRPTGAARSDFARRHEQAMGRLPDQGQTEAAERQMTAAARQLERGANWRRMSWRRVLLAAEPYLYTLPSVLLICVIMLVPLLIGLTYAFHDVRLLDPAERRLRRARAFSRTLRRSGILERAAQHRDLDCRLGELAVRIGVGSCAAAQPAIRRARTDSAAGVSALGDPELSVRI